MSERVNDASPMPVQPMRFHGARVAWRHLRIGLMNEVQYRANFVVQLIQSAVAIGTALVVLALIFGQTDELNGWSRPELLVVMGVFTAVGGIIGFVIEPNMGRLIGDVEQGTFDYVLTKPVDSQVLASTREFRLWRLTDVVVGVAVMVWGLATLDRGVSVGGVLAFVLTLAAGSFLLYCLWLILTTGAFWFTRMHMIQDLFTGLYRAGQYPVTVYPAWLRLGLTYLVPVGFAVTVPSESLVGRLTLERGLITAGFLVAAFVVTRTIWKIGTKRYSGASA